MELLVIQEMEVLQHRQVFMLLVIWLLMVLEIYIFHRVVSVSEK